LIINIPLFEIYVVFSFSLGMSSNNVSTVGITGIILLMNTDEVSMFGNDVTLEELFDVEFVRF
jgi:hypothetical protein